MKKISISLLFVFIALFSFTSCESTSIKLDPVDFEYIG